MKRKILLPTDFSKNAWHAINYALKLYKDDYCDFYILNVFSATSDVIKSLISMEPGSELYETTKAASESELAQVLDMLAYRDHKNPKHHFKPISTFNDVIEAIKNIVEEKDIEMIIMGTKGKTNSRGVAYGSTAINVMEKVRNCPVIVVPESAKHDLPKEIVFPTSFKTHLKKRELNYLIDIAKKCKSSIKILHVSEEDNLDKKQLSNKKLLEEYFEDINHSYHTLSHIDVATAINCFVESRASDMVTFINKKHVFFGSILTHPLVKNIGRDSKVPILVMHDLRN
ncbi:universal stress protein [Changchengzhania lutea]|uniref:universal stress protein n=1 Tax=Changchengzhania lutea TaxID=2049305 RepID=UPI00115CBB65|nr:universal stress protein [Changchengzhania lutea]